MNRRTITQEDQLPKIIRKILNIGSEIMLIPDVLNRNVLVEKIANYIFNSGVKTKQIEVLSDDIKTFCYYQSKVYYYIITTYALLMINFILCNQNEDISENKEKSEEYVRKIIYSGLQHYHKINLRCIKYDDNDQYVDLSSFYKNLRYEFYTKNNFDKYF